MAFCRKVLHSTKCSIEGAVSQIICHERPPLPRSGLFARGGERPHCVSQVSEKESQTGGGSRRPWLAGRARCPLLQADPSPEAESAGDPAWLPAPASQPESRCNLCANAKPPCDKRTPGCEAAPSQVLPWLEEHDLQPGMQCRHCPAAAAAGEWLVPC